MNAASRLWDLLVDAAVIEDFRPMPDDHFHWLYGLAEEDLDDDIILRLIDEMKIHRPEPKSVEDLVEISSPRDLIRLLSKLSSNNYGSE